MAAIRPSRLQVILLIGLVVFTPFALASAYETWPDGIYDAENDEILQAAKCSDENAIECAPLAFSRHVPVVATVAFLGDDSAAPTLVLPAEPCRAPAAS